MADRLVTTGIIVKRIDYGEADRIVTFLTPEHGKLTAMAKGVKRPKSRLAGGIELLSISEITLLKGKGEMFTLISARTKEHFRHIVEDYEHVEVAYTILKLADKLSEDDTNRAAYDLVGDGLKRLDERIFTPELVELSFRLRLLQELGQAPNWHHDCSGKTLKEDTTYVFDVSDGCLAASKSGEGISSNDIKGLRLLTNAPLEKLANVKGLDDIAIRLVSNVRAFYQHHYNLG